jgi:tetratricopeptide (TPR) repeat protein
MGFKPRVFVIMPFGTKAVERKPAAGEEKLAEATGVDFNMVYDRLLKPALLEADCEPFRADKEPGSGDIRIDMFFELVTADIVLADISALNANVFYELGIRHGVSPCGVFVVHGGWGFSRPFDIAPDRAFSYDGSLFAAGAVRDQTWTDGVGEAVRALSGTLREAMRHDRETIGSPVYSHLHGLQPVNWENLYNARARYFGGLLTDWKQRIEIAQAQGSAGDILTLAEDAPTRLHREKLLFAAARALIDLCRFDVARDVLEEVLTMRPDHLDAQCQLGLVNARLGRNAVAMQQMEAVTQQNRFDPEAQGILGRVYKDMWRVTWVQEAGLVERQKRALANQGLAAAAIRSYYAAQERHPESYYNGINAVTLSALLTHLERVAGRAAQPSANVDLARLAVVVRFAAEAAQRRSIEDNNHGEQIWSTATLGELAVVAGDADEARAQYGLACAIPGVTFFNKQSMLGQLDLMDRMDFNAPVVAAASEVIRATLPAEDPRWPKFQKVFVFSGHMIDGPERAQARFPPAKEAVVMERLEKILADWGGGAGDLAVCGAARGGDILFAEVCKRRGAHVRLLLPKREGQFIAESVRLPGSDWVNRFHALMDTCEHWFQDDHLGPPPEGASVHARNNLWILNTGRSEARPRQLYAALVWDEKPTGDGPGGTSHFADEAVRLDAQLEIVNPTQLSEEGTAK